MKANELMIGDWVYSTFSKLPCKITYLKLYEIGYGSVETTNVVGVKDINSLIPIPLTAEILEKNGMHLYNRKTNSLMEECNHSDIFDEDNNYRVELSLDYDGTIRWTINGDEYTIMPLDYVHQLQHALRLCGIPKEIKL